MNFSAYVLWIAVQRLVPAAAAEPGALVEPEPPVLELHHPPFEPEVWSGVIRERIIPLRACYETWAKENSAFKGSPTLRFDIGGRDESSEYAEILSVKIGEGEEHTVPLANCIESALTGVRFRLGTVATVQYPFFEIIHP